MAVERVWRQRRNTRRNRHRREAIVLKSIVRDRCDSAWDRDRFKTCATEGVIANLPEVIRQNDRTQIGMIWELEIVETRDLRIRREHDSRDVE